MHPLGVTQGFKGLIAHVNCNCDSYNYKLGFYFSFLEFLVLLKDEQNLVMVVLFNLKFLYFLCSLLLNICSNNY